MITFWAGWIVGIWMLGRGAIVPASLIGLALIGRAAVMMWGAL